MPFSFLNRIVANRRADQALLLKNLWFRLYSRSGRTLGSSGFEHVFLHEISQKGILGLHNWIYFHEQQREHKRIVLKKLKKQLIINNVEYLNRFIQMQQHCLHKFYIFNFRKRKLWSSVFTTINGTNHLVRYLSARHLNWKLPCTRCASLWILKRVKFRWMDTTSSFERIRLNADQISKWSLRDILISKFSFL